MFDPAVTKALTRPRSEVPGLAFGLAFCVFAFVASYLAFVWTPDGQHWDVDLFRSVAAGTPSPLQGSVDDLLRVIGDLDVLAACCALVVLVATARGQLMLGLASAFIIPCSIGAARLFKLVLLSRPTLGVTPIVLSAANSFPSGHTTAAASVGVAISLVVPPSSRRGIGLLGVLWTAAVGIGVVVAGWHRPSDAIGAAALAGAVYFAVRLACHRISASSGARSAQELLWAARRLPRHKARNRRHRLRREKLAWKSS